MWICVIWRVKFSMTWLILFYMKLSHLFSYKLWFESCCTNFSHTQKQHVRTCEASKQNWLKWKENVLCLVQAGRCFDVLMQWLFVMNWKLSSIFVMQPNVTIHPTHLKRRFDGVFPYLTHVRVRCACKRKKRKEWWMQTWSRANACKKRNEEEARKRSHRDYEEV